MLLSSSFVSAEERALEFFDHDLPVYLLHEDGSETTVNDRKQIIAHEGIFGILSFIIPLRFKDSVPANWNCRISGISFN